MLHFLFDLVEDALNITLFVFIIIKHICIVLVYIYMCIILTEYFLNT